MEYAHGAKVLRQDFREDSNQTRFDNGARLHFSKNAQD